MAANARSLVMASLFGLVIGSAGAVELPTPSGPSLVGIDHTPTVVANLDEAAATYARLGFSVKPGRPHANGLRNAHVKFRDGSGIELISPPERPGDELTRTYARLLRSGEGPVYLSFHARDTAALTSALSKANIAFSDEGGLLTLADPHLDFIFFINDNRSPTDRPEHFAHPNTAMAMTEVWLALDTPARASLRHLLLALGATETSATVQASAKLHATVFTVQNGRVIVLSPTRRSQPGRQILGVKFQVRDARTAARFLGMAPVPVSTAHGLWLRFDEQP